MVSSSHKCLSAEAALAGFGFFTGGVQGDSMLPMLRQGLDLVCIERCSGKLKKFDVPLYRRPDGQLVLHRIVRVRSDGYVTCGDNRRRVEPHVSEAMVLGVLAGFYRGTRYVDCRTDRWYRFYVFLWCRFCLPRQAVLMIREAMNCLWTGKKHGRAAR